jgi:putative GTP pyrophosphokinase
VRRSLSRVAAILETVDLLFEQVLQARRNPGKITEVTSELDVDSLADMLDRLLPRVNRMSHEKYSNLLRDLRRFKVATSKELSDLIEKQRGGIMEAEKNLARGGASAYYSHCGLVRVALFLEFGSEFEKYEMTKKAH